MASALQERQCGDFADKCSALERETGTVCTCLPPLVVSHGAVRCSDRGHVWSHTKIITIVTTAMCHFCK